MRNEATVYRYRTTRDLRELRSVKLNRLLRLKEQRGTSRLKTEEMLVLEFQIRRIEAELASRLDQMSLL